ncbi:THAP domain-containing protein 1-like [Melanaphis sacchari]|uniref:THAP domain-containing protein 1-like n=1 Tax=Melanaphis sacchari TaxID=742174 RepID=UPI000DC142B5|nr:THAP domain-containing protein 1-like [Melanaphis sacchari]
MALCLVDVIFTDFAKAFDKVDHSILAKKLFQSGLRDPLFSWLVSFLSGRKFPLQNPELNAKWIKAVGRKGFIPTKNSRLCNNHFLKSDFKTPVDGTYKLLLRDDAVPSIFNITVIQTPTKIYRSEICEPTSSQLTTTEFSTSVQDEPLCLTPKRRWTFKSAKKESKLRFTTPPSMLELEKKIMEGFEIMEFLEKKIMRTDIKINNLAARIKLYKESIRLKNLC